MSTTSPNPEFLTVTQAAERLALSERFIRRAITDGWLTAHRFGSSLRIAVTDLDALAARARTGPVAGSGTGRRKAKR